MTFAAGSAGAQVLSGLVLVEDELPASVSFQKQIQLDCPPGKVAVSGGGGLGGIAGGGQALYGSLPVNDPPDGWVVVGRDVDGGGTSWGMRASLWCADPPPGAEFASAEMYCPTGTFALAGGAEVFPDQTPLTASRVGTTFAPFWGVSAGRFGPGATVSELDTVLLCHPTPILFEDGFETGSVGFWSDVAP